MLKREQLFQRYAVALVIILVGTFFFASFSVNESLTGRQIRDICSSSSQNDILNKFIGKESSVFFIDGASFSESTNQYFFLKVLSKDKDEEELGVYSIGADNYFNPGPQSDDQFIHLDTINPLKQTFGGVYVKGETGKSPKLVIPLESSVPHAFWEVTYKVHGVEANEIRTAPVIVNTETKVLTTFLGLRRPFTSEGLEGFLPDEVGRLNFWIKYKLLHALFSCNMNTLDTVKDSCDNVISITSIKAGNFPKHADFDINKIINSISLSNDGFIFNEKSSSSDKNLRSFSLNPLESPIVLPSGQVLQNSVFDGIHLFDCRAF